MWPPRRRALLIGRRLDRASSSSRSIRTVSRSRIRASRPAQPGHATPTGVFSVIQKDRWHRSNLYDNAPMYLHAADHLVGRGACTRASFRTTRLRTAASGCPRRSHARCGASPSSASRVIVTYGDVTPVAVSTRPRCSRSSATRPRSKPESTPKRKLVGGQIRATYGVLETAQLNLAGAIPASDASKSPWDTASRRSCA